MKRSFTNIIRYLMDEWLPPVIRDNKYFMYPFYLYAYRGKNISEVMRFKENIYSYTLEQYSQFYNSLDTISRNRKTDLNERSVVLILDSIKESDRSLIDVGCGHGFLLNAISEVNSKIKLSGVDVKTPDKIDRFNFINGTIDSIDESKNKFDVVTCCHTLEHILKPEKFVEKLIKLAVKKLIIVVPCQRYYFYTLDEHVNFFPQKEILTSLIGLKDYTCEKVDGDWVYIGFIGK